MDGDALLRARERSSTVPLWLSDLSPKQRAFYDDKAKTKAAVAGRRGGKTWVSAVGLYEAAREHPRSQCGYIALSGVSARRIFWPVLCEINDRYRLGMRLHSHELTAHLDNGSTIFLVGGDDARKVESIRGSKYARVVIDEAGSFGKELLRYLVQDVIDAALMDLDGDLWITGTPNAACAGYFHDITTGLNPEIARVSTHSWNVLDNPHLPHAGEWLAKKRAERRWDEDHPVYRREYLGHWVRDTSSLVFRFDRARCLYTAADDITRTVIGIDLGTSKSERTTAFVVVGWRRYDRTVYVLHAEKEAAMSPDGVASRARELLERYGAGTIVCDAGGLGAGYVRMMQERHLPVKEAAKRDKLAYVEFLNGELDAGRVLVSPKAKDLIEEIEVLQWNEDRDGYDDRFDDHAADAFLYGWRECYAWTERRQVVGPKPGTREWALEEAKKAKEKAIRDSVKRAKVESKRLLSVWGGRGMWRPS